MASLNIDGIGSVQIDDGFLSLSPEQQAAEVDAIAAQVRGGGAPTAAAAAPAERPLSEEEASTLQAVMAGQPKPDALANRGSILPVGTTKEGQPTLAVPGFLEGPRQTIMDLIEGRRTASQISGKEMFELGSLFAGSAAGGAAGTGAGVARAAAEREALAARPAATPPPIPAAAAARPVGAPALDDAAMAEAARGPVTAAERIPPAADDAAMAAAASGSKPATAAPTTAAPKPVTPGPVIPPTATTAEFKTAAKSYYKQMEDAGVEIAPQATRKLSDEVATAAQKANIDPTLHPRGTAALKRVQEVGDKPLTFERLDQLRQIVKEAGSSPDGGERRIAGILTDKLDDFIEKLGGADIKAGDAAVAKAAIGKAQELWSKFAKLETVDDLVERAKISAPNFSGSGLENALRTEFRALAKNKQKMRTFTAKEQEAIKRVAKGTVTSNIARGAGKFAPTGVVSAVLSGGGGAAIGGPVGAVALPAGGFLARQLATVLTRRHVSQLETVIRNGGESRAASAALARARATLQSLTEDASLPTTSAATDQRR